MGIRKNHFNWPLAVRRLERSGMTLKQIADSVGANSAQVISEIKRGKTQEPKGMVAVRLHGLHGALQERRAAERLAAD